MNIEQEIRAQIEKNKGLKLGISEINNHLSILEGLLRTERADAQKQVEEAYQRGLDDAWEAARKISLMPPDEIEKVFPGAAKYNRYNLGYSGVEAIEKLKAYEEQKADDEIKVGDEVRLCRHIVPYIITSCNGDDGTYILMTVNGGFIKAGKLNVRKTGKHYDIDKILEEMKE